MIRMSDVRIARKMVRWAPTYSRSETVAQSTYPRVTMYSTTWCGDCRRSKRLLDEHAVPYEEINIDESPEAAGEMIRLNRGLRSVPTIVIEGGPTLAEPSNRELAEALGIDFARPSLVR